MLIHRGSWGYGELFHYKEPHVYQANERLDHESLQKLPFCQQLLKLEQAVIWRQKFRVEKRVVISL